MVTLPTCSQDTKVYKRDYEVRNFFPYKVLDDDGLICYLDSEWYGDTLGIRRTT